MDKKINLANMLLKKHIDRNDEKGAISVWRTSENDLCFAAELNDSWLVVMTNHNIKSNGLIGKLYELANDFIDIIQKDSGRVINFSDLDMFDADLK